MSLKVAIRTERSLCLHAVGRTHMTSMTVDYPARDVYTGPRGYLFLWGTTQACIMKDIMCSCLTIAIAYRYKKYSSATSSTAHAPKQFGLVRKTPK